MTSAQNTILIVDDEEDLRAMFAEEFEAEGFRVFSAPSGEEAFDLVLREPDIDIVLSDIRMPNGDGVELLKKIRERDPEKPIVYLLSGFSDYSKDHVRSLGAEDLLIKPFDLEDLIQVFRETLTLRKTA